MWKNLFRNDFRVKEIRLKSQHKLSKITKTNRIFCRDKKKILEHKKFHYKERLYKKILNFFQFYIDSIRERERDEEETKSANKHNNIISNSVERKIFFFIIC